MGRGGGGGPGGCVVLLISNIPEELANVTNIFNMVGMYGDVVAVKILRNKTDCCLVQLAKPHHAQQVGNQIYLMHSIPNFQVRNFLDQAKVGGRKLCVSNSRVEALLNNKVSHPDPGCQELASFRQAQKMPSILSSAAYLLIRDKKRRFRAIPKSQQKR